MRSSFSQPVLELFLGLEGEGNCRVLYDGGAHTVGTILAAVERCVHTLKGLGVARGEVVGLCHNHGLSYLVSLLGIYAADGVAVLINPKLRRTEVQHIIQDSGLRFAMVSEEAGAIVFPNWALSAFGEWGAIAKRPANEISSLVELGEHIKVVVYTSGSSGKPKGVMLTEQGLSASAWSVIEYLGLSRGDCSVIYTPPGYVYALSQTLTHLATRAVQVSYSHGLYSPVDLLECMAKHQVTGVATNPTGLRILTAAAESRNIRIPSARYVMTGGQPLAQNLVLTTRRIFSCAQIINTYGTTETSSRISCWVCPAEPSGEDPLPVGYAVTGTRIRIVNNGQECEDGEAGEVFVRGSTLMAGYLFRPELTRQRLRGGWFATGDRGHYTDHDGLTLLGRLDTVILVGHEKVAPEEVEAFLELIPGVLEAAVAPSPDPIADWKLVAFLVANKPAAPIVDACRAACAAHLSSPKRPSKYVVVEAVPKNLYGKLDRAKLAELVRRL